MYIMALTVNTNMAAANAANALNLTQGSLSNTLARVSSGLRITKAADDAAGQAVAQNLSTRARSGRQAIRNSNDGISVIQTAEAATKEVLNIMDRMRELAVQSASETLDTGERAYVDAEFDQLRNEIDRIATSTEFNDISLSDGTNTALVVQVGVDNNTSSRISISLGDISVSGVGFSGTAIDLSTSTGAKSAITLIDTAMDSVNKIRSDYGAVQNRLTSAINNTSSYVQALDAATSQIQDADYAHETAEMTRLQVMQQAGVAALGQARGMNQSVLSLL
jgi:flagellin